MARETGEVKWFSNEKGYGFIERGDGEDVFVHHSDILGDGFKTLEPGETVEYEVIDAEKGPKALEVVREGGAAAGAGGDDGSGSAAHGSGSVRREDEADRGGGPEEEDRRSLGAQLREKLGGRFFGGGD
jgi:CspA family cold shock protein